MTLAEFAAEFPEIPETWKVLQFFSGAPNGKPADAIDTLLGSGLPECAEKISRFVEPSVYRDLLYERRRKLSVFKHIVAHYPGILGDDDLEWLLKPLYQCCLRVYVSGVSREWTAKEIVYVIDNLGYTAASHLAKGNIELVDYLFGKGGRPLLACEILSELDSPEATRTLMNAEGEDARIYFDKLSPGCFSDTNLYLDAVTHCAPGIPDTIVALFARGTPVTSSLMRNPEFAAFKHYLLACM